MKTNIVSHHGFVIEYFENDCLGTSSVQINKKWEPHILEFLKIYNQEMYIKNIIDIGANFGYHTLFFAKEIEKSGGNVYAFEPQIQNYLLLYNNIQRNHLKNVQTYQQACSNEASIVNLPYIETSNMVNMGDFTLNHQISPNTHIASSVPIDSFIFPQIDLIKIDVQGWELKTLFGATELIKRDKPTMIIEFEEHQLVKTGNNCASLAYLLRNMGYTIYYLEYEYPSDHICVHNDKVEEFELKFGKYIQEHTTFNPINQNITYGVNKKIVLPYVF